MVLLLLVHEGVAVDVYDGDDDGGGSGDEGDGCDECDESNLSMTVSSL